VILFRTSSQLSVQIQEGGCSAKKGSVRRHRKTKPFSVITQLCWGATKEMACYSASLSAENKSELKYTSSNRVSLLAKKLWESRSHAFPPH